MNHRLLVCLHGFLRSSVSMWWVVTRLRSLGYNNIYCPTVSLHTKSLNTHARNLAKKIRKRLAETNCTEIDVVTYSMGGLLYRASLPYLEDVQTRKLVMLAPPNQGAEMATIMRRWIPVHSLGWDPFQQLLPLSPTHLMEPQDSTKVLIIAGKKGDGIGYNKRLSEDNDGKVCLSETKLNRQYEYLEVIGRHPMLILQPSALAPTIQYLSP